jgi:hypothetical protein
MMCAVTPLTRNRAQDKRQFLHLHGARRRGQSGPVKAPEGDLEPTWQPPGRASEDLDSLWVVWVLLFHATCTSGKAVRPGWNQ